MDDITATFNGNPGLSFVNGEDRAFAIALRETDTANPVDLTSCGLHFLFPGAAGYPVRRFSDALTLTTASVVAGGTFSLPAHGLVTGDPVLFSGGSLPAPLVAGTTYLVVVVDANTFSLTSQSGVPIVITGAAGASYSLTCQDVTIVSPSTSGLATLLLRSPVTAAIATGEGQTFQLEVKSSSALRIYLEVHELDVSAQVE